LQEECAGQAQGLGKQQQAKGMAANGFLHQPPRCTPTKANKNAG